MVHLQGGETKYCKAWAQICEISPTEFHRVYPRLGVHLEEKVNVVVSFLLTLGRVNMISFCWYLPEGFTAGIFMLAYYSLSLQENLAVAMLIILFIKWLRF